MLTNQRQESNARVQVIPVQRDTDNGSQEVQKLRVAAYARVSTMEEHQNSSYELQIAYYRDYIKQNTEWEFYKVFADYGITGTNTKDRKEFMQMIEDATKGEIDYIITKSISRFARNTLDCLHYIRLLKGLDPPVGVYFEKEKLDTLDNKSEFFLTILSSIAQEESRSISENTNWAIQKAFQRGEAFIPTTYFLGYDTNEDGEIVINEEEAETVRRIFDLYLGGKGPTEIARILMSEGRLTARSNKNWRYDSVLKILTQEKYMGHALAQKTVTIDYLTHKRVANNNIKPKYFIKNCLPAIVTEEEFYKVQDEIKMRYRKVHDPENKYGTRHSSIAPFSNMLFCGECERPVTRRRLISTKQGQKYTYTVWHCNSACQRDKEHKGCKNQYVWEEVLEKAFMKLLYEMKLSKDQVIADTKEIIAAHGLSDEEKIKAEELGWQIEAVTSRMKELAIRRPASGNDSIYEATVRNLTYERELLQVEYDKLNESKQDGLAIETHLEELLECLDEVQSEADEFKGELFRKLIIEGLVFKKNKVRFKFKCDLQKEVDARRMKK